MIIIKCLVSPEKYFSGLLMYCHKKTEPETDSAYKVFYAKIIYPGKI